ncbi:hypothetical protein [Vibrio sp. 1CM23M]|uniref:hypothetical protein n=1 Tax=Vibrio sp. 1CM23M TaxID=2929164 RepID=UPI0020BF39C0|nr:hypothetical protein [Vibrio sp. 1CM23M]MCK8072418.1 hypothetical protein [Vibrio sp. 1CM23M]
MSFSTMLIKLSVISITSTSSFLVIGEQLTHSESFTQIKDILIATDCEEDKSCLVSYDNSNDTFTIDKTLETAYEIQRKGLIELADVMELNQGIKLDKQMVSKTLKESLRGEIDNIKDKPIDTALNVSKISKIFSDLKKQSITLLNEIKGA